MKHPDKQIMRDLIEYTIKEAGRSLYETGCFIVKGNKIVSKAISHVNHDLTAHAEINAIRKLNKARKNKTLKGCWIYSTQMPCPMCTAAIIWGDAEGIVWGWDGRWEWNTLKIHPKKIIKLSKSKIKLHGPFLEDECLKIKGYRKQ